MLARGADEACAAWFSQSARMLGVDFDYSRVPERLTAVGRVRDTSSMIQRTTFLPVSAPVKLEVLTTVVLPKASWGCWFFTNLQPWVTMQQAVNKCATFRQQVCHLWAVPC